MEYCTLISGDGKKFVVSTKACSQSQMLGDLFSVAGDQPSLDFIDSHDLVKVVEFMEFYAKQEDSSTRVSEKEVKEFNVRISKECTKDDEMHIRFLDYASRLGLRGLFDLLDFENQEVNAVIKDLAYVVGSSGEAFHKEFKTHFGWYPSRRENVFFLKCVREEKQKKEVLERQTLKNTLSDLLQELVMEIKDSVSSSDCMSSSDSRTGNDSGSGSSRGESTDLNASWMTANVIKSFSIAKPRRFFFRFLKLQENKKIRSKRKKATKRAPTETSGIFTRIDAPAGVDGVMVIVDGISPGTDNTADETNFISAGEAEEEK